MAKAIETKKIQKAVLDDMVFFWTIEPDMGSEWNYSFVLRAKKRYGKTRFKLWSSADAFNARVLNDDLAALGKIGKGYLSAIYKMHRYGIKKGGLLLPTGAQEAETHPTYENEVE